MEHGEKAALLDANVMILSKEGSPEGSDYQMIGDSIRICSRFDWLSTRMLVQTGR
jgi:hypothetical protein